MLHYHAAYYRDEESGWYAAVVLDFPGTISQGRSINSARRMLREALMLMAECLVERGEALPKPNRRAKDSKADYCEPIRLSFRVQSAEVLA